MKLKPRTIQFDYLSVYCQKLEDSNVVTEKKYDLTGILEKAALIESKDTTYDYRGEKARIQKVKYDKNNGVWELQFLRLREICPPGVAKDDGTFEIFHLEDGEYIGESVSALYDKKDNIFVMQRNINSLPPSGIEEYLNSCITTKDLTIILKPVISGTDIDKITSSKIYRSLQIGLASKDIQSLSDNSPLGSILNNLSKYDGSRFNIRITVGNAKRDKSLSPGLVSNTVKGLYENNSATQLKVATRDNPNTKVEYIDLLDDRRKDKREFNVSKDKPITHELVYPELLRIYLDRKNNNNIF